MSYLGLFIGSMKSGKTSRLIELNRKYTFIGKRVVVINYAGDTRYSTENMVSHDGAQIPCIMADTLASVFETHNSAIQSADVILINEGQFFPDLKEVVIWYVEELGKRVYIAGLDGDFKREKFGSLLDLIPMCDEVVKLHAICAQCRDGTPAIFSKRITEEADQVVIGTDNYMSVCRACYKQ